MKISSKNLIQFLCESFLNVVNGNDAINKKLIETHQQSFRKILYKQTGMSEKKRIFGRASELLKTVGLSCYFYLMKS